MNNLPIWKRKLIKLIAGNEPVIMNVTIFGKRLPQGMTAVVICPPNGEVKPASSYEDKAFIVPTKNILCS